MTSLQSAAVLRPDPRPIAADDLAPDCFWRGVCEYPGGTPAQMAIEVGKAVLAAAEVRAEQVQWILHTGSGAQGSQGWPIHHHIQNAIVGRHGNALEVKQNCAGALTSWLIASRLIDDDGVAICTGADNWAWTDRLSMTKQSGGEPFADAAYAAAIGPGRGFAKLLGSATASAPAAADDWQINEEFWETTTTAEGFSRAYADATDARSEESKRDIVSDVRHRGARRVGRCTGEPAVRDPFRAASIRQRAAVSAAGQSRWVAVAGRTARAQPGSRLSRGEHARGRAGASRRDRQSEDGLDRVIVGLRIPDERDGNRAEGGASTSGVGGRDGAGHLVSSVLTSQVGTMDLLDLKVIGEFYGRNFLPYPFMFTRPSRFATLEEASAYAVTVPDRYLHGDLRTFVEPAIAYLYSDIRVECHVQHIPAETPSVRAMAWRTGQLGFFGAQRPDEDVVDVHTVSPYDLGAAIAEAVPLQQPGRHSAIVVPEYVSRPGGEFAAEAFSVNDRVAVTHRGDDPGA